MEPDQKKAVQIVAGVFLAGILIGAVIMWAMLSLQVSVR